MNTTSPHIPRITVIPSKPLRTPPTMNELHLAAECLRLKASLYDSGVQITGLEERLRAAAKRNAQLTAALHRQATCA